MRSNHLHDHPKEVKVLLTTRNLIARLDHLPIGRHGAGCRIIPRSNLVESGWDTPSRLHCSGTQTENFIINLCNAAGTKYITLLQNPYLQYLLTPWTFTSRTWYSAAPNRQHRNVYALIRNATFKSKGTIHWIHRSPRCAMILSHAKLFKYFLTVISFSFIPKRLKLK